MFSKIIFHSLIYYSFFSLFFFQSIDILIFSSINSSICLDCCVLSFINSWYWLSMVISFYSLIIVFSTWTTVVETSSFLWILTTVVFNWLISWFKLCILWSNSIIFPSFSFILSCKLITLWVKLRFLLTSVVSCNFV